MKSSVDHRISLQRPGRARYRYHPGRARPHRNHRAQRNLIWRDGSIRTLDIRSGESLVIRDNDFFGVTANGGMQIDAAGEIEFLMSDGDWRSPLSVLGADTPTLNGNLVLSFESDAVATADVGQTFNLFDWQVTPTGQFNIVSRYAWDTSRLYSTGEVTLTDAAFLPGDANGDRQVDDADFAVWELNRFLSHTDWRRGDFNGDGRSDVADFNVWHAHRMSPTPTAMIPEPHMAISVAMATVVLLTSAARKRPLPFSKPSYFMCSEIASAAAK